MRFWDSSAVVPLLIGEPSTPAMRALLRRDVAMIVWSLTPVEVLSALWRRRRAGELDDVSATTAQAALVQLEPAWSRVVDVTAVERRARRLLGVHPLRAADALQLSAALVASGERPDLLDFVTLDVRLADCARREGFTVFDGA